MMSEAAAGHEGGEAFIVSARIGCDAERRYYGPFDSSERAERFGAALFGNEGEAAIAGNPSDCTRWDVEPMQTPAAVAAKLVEAVHGR